MKTFALAAAIALLSAAPAYAQAQPATAAKRAMTFEDMMHMKRLGGTAVSPDGKWLAYSVTTVDLEQNAKTSQLWLAAIPQLGSASAHSEPAPVSIALPGDSGIQFSHDGKQILFLSSRQGGRQVWLAGFDAATGAFGPARKLTRLSTEADGAIWAPDGQSIVFVSSVYPDCPAITVADPSTGDACNAARDAALAASKVQARIFTHLLYRHWNAFTGDKRSHLFAVAADSGATRDLNPNDPRDVPPFSLGGPIAYDISPDSRELAFEENLDPEPAISTNADIFTLDLSSPSAKPVKVSTSPGGDFSPAYSPDGKYLAWRSQARAGYESDKFRLVVYDRAAKTIENLLPKLDNWVDEFAWNPDSKTLLFTSAEAGEEPVFLADLKGHYAELAGKGEIGDPHPLPGGSSAVISVQTVNRPSELAELRYSTNYLACDTPPCQGARAGYAQIVRLNNALLAQLDLSPLESFWFPAPDKASVGVKAQGFLVKPPAFDPAKKYPVKFLIHGGPQGAWGDAWSYRWNAELLAANGYVVVMINPRGSTGYGQAFVDGVNRDWGGKPFTDLMAGLDYAEKNFPFLDKSRECALGASYGGYMANWVLGHTNRFQCIVSHDGMFNPESAYGSTEELWFNEWEFHGKPWDYYGKPDAENPYRRWSPALSARNFKTPTLVIHGQLDYRLDASEGYQLFTTLQRLKVPSKMLYFPDEGHWVLKPQNSQLWYKTVNDWVDRWTGNRD